MQLQGELRKSLEIVHLMISLAKWPAVKHSGNMPVFLEFGYTPTGTVFVDIKGI